MYADHARNGAGELRKYVMAARRIGCSTDQYKENIAKGLAWCSYGRHWKVHTDFGTTSLGRKDSYCLECRQTYRK